MWQLLAEGTEPRQRWRQRLESQHAYTLGRAVSNDLPVPWESLMSREHCRLLTTSSAVLLEKLPQARNPVYFNGEPVDRCELVPGSRFVIGQTSFRLSEVSWASNSPSDVPIEEVTFSRQELQAVHFEDADRRIEALARLPHVIEGAGSRHERASRLIGLILSGLRNAEAVAVVSKDRRGQVSVIEWERRTETAGTFRPSTHLVTDALHQWRSIVHVWEAERQAKASDSPANGEDYTVSVDFDWAFCTPVHSDREQSWGLYIAGRMQDPALGRLNLQADVRFTELVGEVMHSVERLNRMEGSLSVLRQFLSPPILAALENTGSANDLNTSLLEPRECSVTVLFCDLRGFSQRAEEAAGDLQGLLRRVSAALEIMTTEILNHGGVTGDFLGDAVLGYWGWPFPSEEAALKACLAALAIRRRFDEIRSIPAHPLADFEMGIGVAHGPAVAGKIGTRDRMTVTVFGPVVNIASRLEGLTKRLRAPIILDEATADKVRSMIADDEGRLRTLARVLPYGMETPLMVSELLPPEDELPELTSRHLQTYSDGVRQFIAGKWEEAYRAFHEMPSSDRAQDFLLAIIAQHARQAPPNWNGTIELPHK